MDLTRRSTTTANPEDLTWLGPGNHGHDMTEPITLDAAAFLAAFPDGWVPSGVEVSKGPGDRYYPGITDVGGAGVAGTDPGFLFRGVEVTAGTNPGASLFVHGSVIEAKLPVASDDATAHQLIRFI